MTALAGPYMGAGAGKGKTHNWIVRRTGDAAGAVSPRTILVVLVEAALATLRRDRLLGSALLRHVDLMRGLEAASPRRVSELAEEHPEVMRLNGLNGRNLLLGQGEMEAAVASQNVDDGYGANGAAVLERLVELGVVSPIKEADGTRYDVVDIYRFAFNIGRRGGPQRGAARNARAGVPPI